MLQTYDRLYRPQAELIASITNPETFSAYAEDKKQKAKAKEEGGPQTYTVADGNTVRSSSTADTYFDPEKGLVDYSGKVLITKEEYLKRANDGGMMVSL
jgi:hypothetical protein